MLTIENSRKTLTKKVSESLSDEELILVRDELWDLASVFVEHALNVKNCQHG